MSFVLKNPGSNCLKFFHYYISFNFSITIHSLTKFFSFTFSIILVKIRDLNSLKCKFWAHYKSWLLEFSILIHFLNRYNPFKFLSISTVILIFFIFFPNQQPSFRKIFALYVLLLVVNSQFDVLFLNLFSFIPRF